MRTLADLARNLVRVDWREHAALLRWLARWLLLGSVVGVLAGASSAVFLYGLALATAAQTSTSWLLLLLPVGGLVVGLGYHHLGGRSAGGNNLIVDELHGLAADVGRPADDHRWLPRRMAPLVLLGTWVTHLFGGSAGREGTAIQMSGSLSDGLSRALRLGPSDRRLVLVAAVAGGFGSVFSVPLAGAVFGLEVQRVGRIRHDALVPALAASLVGNVVFHALDLPHDVTPRLPLPEVALAPGLLLRVAVASLAFAAAALLFVELTEGLRRAFRRLVAHPALRPAVGGLVVVALVLLLDARAYTGLSLPLIGEAIGGGQVVAHAFALKLLLTAVTLGAGFQGGEVTPLFVIGATLGAALAGPLGVDQGLLASIGFVAVFAAATNTPLACIVMGVELFGAGALPYLALGCVLAYVASSHRGIYSSQRIDAPKGATHPGEASLQELGEDRPGWLRRR